MFNFRSATSEIQHIYQFLRQMLQKKIFWPITVGQTSFYILDFDQNNCLHIVSSNFEVNYTDGIFCGLRRAV